MKNTVKEKNLVAKSVKEEASEITNSVSDSELRIIAHKLSERVKELNCLYGHICPYVDDLHDLLKRGSIAERRAFIKNFVKEVKVAGKVAIISYFVPPSPDKKILGKEGVPLTV